MPPSVSCAMCHPELPMKKVTRRALRGHFHSPVVPAGHGNLRRIRDPKRSTPRVADPSTSLAGSLPSHENVGIAAGAGLFMAAGGSWDPWIPQDDTYSVPAVQRLIVPVVVVDDMQVRLRLGERDLLDQRVRVVAEALQPARDVAAASVVRGQGREDPPLVVTEQLRHEPGPELETRGGLEQVAQREVIPTQAAGDAAG